MYPRTIPALKQNGLVGTKHYWNKWHYVSFYGKDVNGCQI